MIVVDSEGCAGRSAEVAGLEADAPRRGVRTRCKQSDRGE
jgi:hypothetical protein